MVLQDIRSKVANAAGKGTFFVNFLQDFLKTIHAAEGEFKAVRFIKGFESNLTFFATNTIPDDIQAGAKKLQLSLHLFLLNIQCRQYSFHLRSKPKIYCLWTGLSGFQD